MLKRGELILILTTGRAGSSMVADIFHRHGCWVGPSRSGDEWNPKGYFENTRIKRALQGTFGSNITEDYPAPEKYFDRIFMEILEEQGYEGGPLIVKTGFFYWRVFRNFLPQHVLVRRPIPDVIASYRDSRFIKAFSDKQVRKVLRRFDADMNRAAGFDVHTDEVVAGNYRSLENAIKGVGLGYKKEIVDDVVEPGYWHFGKSK